MPSDERRERLVQQVREIARDLSGVSLETISEHASFLELGFDSLFLTQLSSACQKAFGVRITFRQLFTDLKSVARLGAYVDEQLPADHVVPARTSTVQKPVPAADTRALASGPPPSIIAAPVPSQVSSRVEPRTTSPALSSPLTVQQAIPVAGLERMLLQQLELMAAQLRCLQGFPADLAMPLPELQSAARSASAGLPAPVSNAPTVESVLNPSQVGSGANTEPTEKPKEQPPVKMSSGFGPSGVADAGSQPLSPSQQKHLERLIRNYTQKTAGSKERTQQYRRHLADPRTAAGFNPLWKEIVYPIWVQRSSGSKLWDVDGNEYVDLLNGFGPIFLGHAPNLVTRAIEEQLSCGFEVGPQTLLAGEVAEMICRLTGMDRASFTCTGSEAVQAAMRLSRTFTGRDKIVVFSRDYHGNFDQVLVHQANRDGQLCTMPSAPGVPFRSVEDTYVMEYGTEEALNLIKKYAGEIAAVLVEPVQSRRPDFQPREFLQELRHITRESGIVLIFDEVVTGFRCAPGGAQAYFGVEADLATYGKVIGGGMPIGVVAGRSSIMDIFDGGFWRYGDGSFPEAGVTFFAGTFVRHPLTIAAAHATLKYLIHEGPSLQKRVSDKAGKFADRVNALFKKYDLKIDLPRFTSQMYLRNEEHAELAPLFGAHLRYRGVHILEGFPCYMTDAHTDEDIEHLEQAFTDSVEAMVEDGIIGNRSKLTTSSDSDLRWHPAPATCSPLPQSAGTAQPRARTIEYSSTDLQREMWIAARMRPEASAASNGTNVVELVGPINVSALEAAIAEVVKRHHALRTTFSEDGNTVAVHCSMPIPLRCHDLSELTPADAAFRLTAILAEDARQIFDLAKGPLASFQLIKLSPDRHLFVFTAQMIICDGWGFKVVLEEISGRYAGFVEGREPSIKAATQMEEYALWQAQERDSVEAKQSDEFWLSQFTTPPSPLDLPTPVSRPRIRSYEAGRCNLRLTPQLYQSIKRASHSLGSTPFALLLAGFSTWLYRISGKDDFTVGVPFAGQGELGFNTIVGQCVHTLPFRFKLSKDTPFLDELARTQKLILDAQEHWRSNLGTIIQKLDTPSDPSRIPLAPVIFNLDPALTGVQFSGCTSRVTSGPRYYFHYDLGFNLVDEGETLLVECDYNSNLFENETVRDWVTGFQSLMEAVTSDGRQLLGQLPVLSDNAAPRSFQPSRSIPASLSGKSLQATTDDYLAPCNETEGRLAQLWCETLNLERVSCSANFFEVGGQSLSAVSLFAKIEHEFGKKLPLATLFNAPTIEALATVLQGEDGRGSWSSLVAISPSGSKPPLFLVHGAGGNVLLYRNLAQYLAPDVPLYGLQSKGLDGKSQPPSAVEEMADCYVRELRTIRPKGPYYLGGYCLGGTIAYEMAQILHRQGEEVPLVAMLDTYNYSLALKVSFRSFLYQKARFHLANMSALRPSQMVTYLREKMRLGLGGELANLKTSMPGSSVASVSRATSGPEAAIQAINDYAAEHYNPVPYPGRLTLFKPRFNYKFYPDPNMGWRDLAAALDIVEVAVNPHSMLLEPHVKVLAAQLKERINWERVAPGSEHRDSELVESVA